MRRQTLKLKRCFKYSELNSGSMNCVAYGTLSIARWAVRDAVYAA